MRRSDCNPCSMHAYKSLGMLGYIPWEYPLLCPVFHPQAEGRSSPEEGSGNQGVFLGFPHRESFNFVLSNAKLKSTAPIRGVHVKSILMACGLRRSQCLSLP